VDPDDGNACTTDSCNPVTGVSNVPVDPDDGVACTVDSCDPATGIINAPEDSLCDDFDLCTADVCDTQDGCVNTPVPDSETATGVDGLCNTGDDNLALFGPDAACGTGDEGVGDGSCDTADNCPGGYNLTQADSDLDGIGDACDPTPCPGTSNILSISDGANGLPGETVTVPVLLSDVTDQGVISADITLEFNPAVLAATSVAAGTLTAGCTVTPNPTPGRITISVYCSDPLTGSGSLAEVTFDVVGALGESSPLQFSWGVLNEGTPEVCRDNGLFAIPEVGDIEGRVLYYRDSGAGAEPGTEPVEGMAVSLSGSGPAVPDSVATDASGYYVLSGKPFGETYTITGSKAGGFGAGVISSFDAALNAQDVVGIITLTPGQRLAADVSGNGADSSFDSALIAQFAIGLITEFPVAAAVGSDWFLVPVPASVPNQTVHPPDPAAASQGSISYAPLAGSAADQDFLAGLFGDVSGNFQAGAAPAGTESATFQDKRKPQRGGRGARLSVASVAAAPGEIFQVSIDADRAEGAIAFDLLLRFDPTVVQPLSVELGYAASAFSLTSNLTEPGRVRLGLFDSQPLPGSGTIAIVTLQAVGQVGDQTMLDLEGSLDEGRLAATSRPGKVRVRGKR
jgi:hypothetical protein